MLGVTTVANKIRESSLDSGVRFRRVAQRGSGLTSDLAASMTDVTLRSSL
jgi:hypothetical protein